ncbi:5-hydroxyisourate hydrolase-like [Daphnia carinata]|uniref:5-hydroxyisourate hydrolase-like n=1 Tax=Daphnia carinata TaxID=120202 RepID=UPI00257D19C9|nr:5-hydroxyisourate hydrolase-like [Daphnia carinata]
MASNYSPLTTHVLNTATGKPANGMQIMLHRMKSDSSWEILRQGKTNEDGRLPGLLSKDEFSAGMYKMFFDTSSYFKEMHIDTFYPYVEVIFNILNTNEHYHVPLLVSPFGYSTYRGS